MSYGGSFTDTYRLAGIYTARILKGEKPGKLPVQQGHQGRAVHQPQDRQALGLSVPLSLLGRADDE
jgi:putative ABC transport system substrate-binding protein